MKNNYDPIANNYDWLSKLVFGRRLILSQIRLLQHIPAKSKILIAGGGTGLILEEITRMYNSGLSITYVEISEKMNALAQKRNIGENNVRFVTQAIEDFPASEKYDIVFTGFLFDNFSAEKATLALANLSGMLEKKGKWLFVDFYLDQKKSKWWQKLLLKSMLIFFRVVSNIEATTLLPMEQRFKAAGFREMYTYSHCRGFIKSSVYMRF